MSREDLQKAIKDTLIKYKEIIFCADTPICTEHLNELRRLQVFDQIVYRKKLSQDTVRKLTWENIAVNGEMMINKITHDVLGPKFDYNCYKEKC